MAGLLLIAMMTGYATVSIWLFIKTKPVWAKVVVLVAAILIPTADDIYYRRQLDAYCKSEAGYKIYEHASKRSGLVDNTITRADYMKSYPLDIVEAKDEVSITNEGVLYKFYRFERQIDGSIKAINIKTLTAPYEFIRKEKNTGAFLETESAIIERQTGKVLGKRTNLNYYGGWWRRGVLGSIAASGPTRVANCGIGNGVYEGQIKLINQVFTKD